MIDLCSLLLNSAPPEKLQKPITLMNLFSVWCTSLVNVVKLLNFNDESIIKFNCHSALKWYIPSNQLSSVSNYSYIVTLGILLSIHISIIWVCVYSYSYEYSYNLTWMHILVRWLVADGALTLGKWTINSLAMTIKIPNVVPCFDHFFNSIYLLESTNLYTFLSPLPTQLCMPYFIKITHSSCYSILYSR